MKNAEFIKIKILFLHSIFALTRHYGGQIFILHSTFFISSKFLPTLARLLLLPISALKIAAKRKVLVCDDDPATCELIAVILSDAGYEVQEVYDGAGALKDLKRRRYEVMILDYLLGQTNGLDILQKACQLDHKVRIIMMSGYKSDDLPKRALELGASGFLSKPFLIQELLNAVGKNRHKGR